MSFLNRKKEENKKPAVIAEKREIDNSRDLSYVLLRPRVTEKASSVGGGNVFAFEIAQSATKRDVAMAVLSQYKVKPVKIAIVPIPRKRVIVRGKRGIKKGGKKAYVYLKKGEKIEVI